MNHLTDVLQGFTFQPNVSQVLGAITSGSYDSKVWKPLP